MAVVVLGSITTIVIARETLNGNQNGGIINTTKLYKGKESGVLNGNQIDDKLAELIAFLKADYMFSGEAERIQNAKRNDEKYSLLCETWQSCYELCKQFKGKLDGNNPDFPCGCHLIRLVLPTEDDEIVLREIKSQLANSISNCDEVNIDTDIKGNVRIHFGFEDVYTEQ